MKINLRHSLVSPCEAICGPTIQFKKHFDSSFLVALTAMKSYELKTIRCLHHVVCERNWKVLIFKKEFRREFSNFWQRKSCYSMTTEIETVSQLLMRCQSYRVRNSTCLLNPTLEVPHFLQPKVSFLLSKTFACVGLIRVSTFVSIPLILYTNDIYTHAPHFGFIRDIFGMYPFHRLLDRFRMVFDSK